MSLDKFIKIEDNKGQFLPDNELEIYGKDPIKTSFGKWPNDTLRVIIYDGSNNPLPQKDWGLVRYINQEEFPQYYKKDDTIVSGTTKKYSVDIRRLIKDAGYNIGIFTVETMFINSRLGTEDKPNRVWIQEISPSRTEVRVLPFDLGDTKYKNTNILLSDIVAERYTAFLDDEEFKEDIWESIEPFLDLITVNDIQQLFISRVTEPLYQQILREYFNNNINVFNRVMFDVVKNFKLAVQYELDNLDSTIGYGYNQLNPNFGKTNTRERVTVDFPQFCFDTLILSLDCFVPVIVDFFETEIDDTTTQNPFTEIRPRVTIPTVGDPNPTTTTLSPDQTTTTTDAPKPPIDRGQGKVKIELWTNLPPNMRSEVDSDYLEHYRKYEGKNMNESDIIPHLKYHGGFLVSEYDTLRNEQVPLNDPDWYVKNPYPTQNAGESFVDYSNRVTKWSDDELKETSRVYRWSDAKMVFAKQKIEKPKEPFDNAYDCYRPMLDKFPTPRYNHTIPSYYLKSNGGPEKRIEIFKGNSLRITLGGRNGWNVHTSTISELNRQKEIFKKSIKEKIPNYTHVDNIDAISYDYYNSTVVSNRQYVESRGGSLMSPGIKNSFFYETETWVFDDLVDLDTGESLSVVSNSFNIFFKFDTDRKILLRYKRIKMFHIGLFLSYTWLHLGRGWMPETIDSQGRSLCNEPTLYGIPSNIEPASYYVQPYFDENNRPFTVLVGAVGGSPGSAVAYWNQQEWPRYVSNAYSSQNEYILAPEWSRHKRIVDMISVTDPETERESFYAPISEQPPNVVSELATADYRESDFI